MDNIEKRLSNLENLVNYLSKQLTNNKFYTDADIAGCRQIEESNTTDIRTNSEDIVETQVGLAETYEETNTGITQCEIAITELYEMITPTTE